MRQLQSFLICNAETRCSTGIFPDPGKFTTAHRPVFTLRAIIGARKMVHPMRHVKQQFLGNTPSLPLGGCAQSLIRVDEKFAVETLRFGRNRIVRLRHHIRCSFYPHDCAMGLIRARIIDKMHDYLMPHRVAHSCARARCKKRGCRLQCRPVDTEHSGQRPFNGYGNLCQPFFVPVCAMPFRIKKELRRQLPLSQTTARPEPS